MLKIEIAYANKTQQKIIELLVSDDALILQIIHHLNINQEFPEIDFNNLKIGVFGKLINDLDNYKLKDGDRIEIYRPLTKTPNQRRLERAKANDAPNKF
jgi:putative ubiquitin-RnfH superfamily antitoxin RatB of RatAB toxin-antitoxin module